MARKKVRKTTRSARKTSRRTSRSISKKTEKTVFKGVVASDRKVNLITSNLLTFVLVFLISLGLYYVSSSEFYQNLFWMISMLSGFLSLAIFIVYLIFMFMRYLRK